MPRQPGDQLDRGHTDGDRPAYDAGPICAHVRTLTGRRYGRLLLADEWPPTTPAVLSRLLRQLWQPDAPSAAVRSASVCWTTRGTPHGHDPNHQKEERTRREGHEHIEPRSARGPRRTATGRWSIGGTGPVLLPAPPPGPSGLERRRDRRGVRRLRLQRPFRQRLLRRKLRLRQGAGADREALPRTARGHTDSRDQGRERDRRPRRPAQGREGRRRSGRLTHHRTGDLAVSEQGSGDEGSAYRPYDHPADLQGGEEDRGSAPGDHGQGCLR